MAKNIPYVNTEVAKRDFKYYIFDWDDNILHMPTKIRLEHLEPDGTWKITDVSTSTYALVRSDTAHYRPPHDGGWSAAFVNFQDTIGKDETDENNCFIQDTIKALERVEQGEVPGPSFTALKKTLRDGRLFAIVTARGHSPATIEKAVRIFIQRALTDEDRATMMSNLRGYRQWIDGVGDGEFGTDEEELDYYLSQCRYSAVTYEGFTDLMKRDPLYRDKLSSMTHGERTELAKEFAIRDFVEHIFHMLRRAGQLDHLVSIGFSDDDRGNVKFVSNYIREELSKRFDGIKFVVYDTSDRTLKKGRKVCVSGQLNLPGF